MSGGGVYFPNRWEFFLYTIGSCILFISTVFVIFTLISVFQVLNESKKHIVTISGKERLLLKVFLLVLFVDFFNAVSYFIPPTPTGSFLCTFQSVTTIFMDCSVLTASFNMAMHVYLIVTGKVSVEYLFQTFRRNVILGFVYPFIAMILVPILKNSANVGFTCFIETDAFYFKFFSFEQ